MQFPFAPRLLNARRASWLALAALSVGCAAPLTAVLLPSEPKTEPVMAPHDAESAAVADLKNASLRKATAAQPVTEDEAFSSVLAQLQEIRAIDPAAEREVMADLQNAKPENYALIVDAFRTALAYRQQLAAREQAAVGPAPPVNGYEDATANLMAQHLRERQLENVPPRRSPAVAPVVAQMPADQPPVDETPTEPTTRVVERRPLATPAPQQLANDSADPRVEPATLRPSPATRAISPIEPPPEPADDDATAIASDDSADQAVLNSPHRQVLPASATVAVASPFAASGDWHVQLDAAIADLEQSVAPKPRNVAELHDHLRLRTLQLLAGRDEQAYRPIPGASPAQQDFWSKQLFAISAYLNATTQLDDKQRAMAALGPLDEARAKLSELATLQVRNLGFVESVDGFGAYKPSKATAFKPGQKVSLYAEVENFSSSASEKGHHTSLGTSYQVLDKSGRRVDGKQFPDVQDNCRNRRRDFHMQYELALPTRIYPGPYELELTITDHNSGKIGHATLPFEIAGDE